MRKVIQMTVTHIPETECFASGLVHHVLCDDGTMWYLEDANWEQIKSIPQDSPETD